MNRLVTGMSLVGVLFFLLFGISASAGTAINAKSKPPTLRTLVASHGTIYAFAQDGDAIAWIGGDARVNVRRLSTGRSWIVGKISRPERVRSAVLALAGTRALWSWYDGGNSTEYPIVTGAPGQASVTIDTLGGGLNGTGDGRDPTGLAGDGTTLA